MKKNKKLYTILYVLFCFSSSVLSQHTVTLHIQSRPAKHFTDTIFAAGSFNDWQPNKPGYNFFNKDSSLLLQLNNVPAGLVQFKFTRGNWQKAECAITGADIENHTINLDSDTTIDLSIAAWKDDFANSGKQHTASPNVKIIDTAFKIPQLGRTRRVWIYLPADYKKSRKKYPVMYLQDGQNIFDEYTAFAGEWNVDKTLDTLIAKGTPPCIVVAIDNGPQRMTEYNPYDFDKFGKGEGDLYVDFLATTLKPYIDKKYRTLPSKGNTIIGGSSMGGLIAYYAILKYPNVFGKGGIFSPSFWIADKINGFTDTTGDKVDGKLFFYIGALEGEVNVKNMEEITKKLGDISPAIIYTVVDPEGQHNEQAWSKWFGPFYKWIMANGFNNVIEADR